MSEQAFREKLQNLINCESMENGSDTPDFMLADYLMSCLNTWNEFQQKRETYFGRNLQMPKEAP